MPVPSYLTFDPIVPGPAFFDDGQGAEVQFLGTVRGEEGGQPISGIEYSAYEPMAAKVLADLIERGQREHATPHAAEVRHRLGFVANREPSLLIRIRSRHSAAAFDLCRWYLHEIKTTVPIWKRPVFLSDSPPP